MYVGSAVDLYNRLYAHLMGHTSNLHLQNAIALYGLSSFVFTVVEFCDKDLLVTREQHYLDLLFSMDADLRYNFLSTAGSSLGYTHTDSTKRAMRASYSDSRRARIGALNRGKSL